MTYSEAVRLMMDECDVHGLHHEVLSEFMHSVNNAIECQDKIEGYWGFANAALWEWDI